MPPIVSVTVSPRPARSKLGRARRPASCAASTVALWLRLVTVASAANAGAKARRCAAVSDNSTPPPGAIPKCGRVAAAVSCAAVRNSKSVMRVVRPGMVVASVAIAPALASSAVRLSAMVSATPCVAAKPAKTPATDGSVMVATVSLTVSVTPDATEKCGNATRLTAAERLATDETATLNALIEGRFSDPRSASRLAAESASVMLWPGRTENDGSPSSVRSCARVRLALRDISTLPARAASGVPAMVSRLSAVSNTAMVVPIARPAAFAGSFRRATESRTTNRKPFLLNLLPRPANCVASDAQAAPLPLRVNWPMRATNETLDKAAPIFAGVSAMVMPVAVDARACAIVMVAMEPYSLPDQIFRNRRLRPVERAAIRRPGKCGSQRFTKGLRGGPKTPFFQLFS